MGDTVETQELLARLGCCDKGDAYIRLREADAMDGPEETGWCLTLHGAYDLARENIELCPWCGRKVPHRDRGPDRDVAEG